MNRTHAKISASLFIRHSAVKEDENGAGTQKHRGFWQLPRSNPGTARVSTALSKADVILPR
jgi:hypothetical protein